MHALPQCQAFAVQRLCMVEVAAEACQIAEPVQGIGGMIGDIVFATTLQARLEQPASRFVVALVIRHHP